MSEPKLGFTLDLEGTLVDLELLHFAAFEAAIATLGVRLTIAQITALPGAIGGGDDRVALLMVEHCRKNDLGEFNKDQILSLKRSHFHEIQEEHAMTPRPGAAEVLEKIRAFGYPIALGSLTPRLQGEEILRRSGLDKFFGGQNRVFREDVANGKPHPEVYRRTAELLGVSVQLQVVFEDSLTGICAARAAGSVPIGMPVPMFHEEWRIQALTNDGGARRVFKSWHEVDVDALAKSIL